MGTSVTCVLMVVKWVLLDVEVSNYGTGTTVDVSSHSHVVVCPCTAFTAWYIGYTHNVTSFVMVW